MCIIYIIQSKSAFKSVCELLAAGLWFSLGTSVSSTNKTDRHDIHQILKVPLNTITLIHLKVTNDKDNAFLQNMRLLCTIKNLYRLKRRGQ